MRRKLLVTASVLIMALNLIACGQTTKEESAKIPDTTVTEFVEGENCTSNPVSGIEVFYEAKLICDNEDIGLKDLFDKDGNLINIYLPDEAGDPRVFTFPD